MNWLYIARILFIVSLGSAGKLSEGTCFDPFLGASGRDFTIGRGLVSVGGISSGVGSLFFFEWFTLQIGCISLLTTITILL